MENQSSRIHIIIYYEKIILKHRVPLANSDIINRYNRIKKSGQGVETSAHYPIFHAIMLSMTFPIARPCQHIRSRLSELPSCLGPPGFAEEICLEIACIKIVILNNAAESGFIRHKGGGTDIPAPPPHFFNWNTILTH